MLLKKPTKQQTIPKRGYCLHVRHLYYSDRQNEKAFRYFDSVKDQPKYSKLVRPYYVQMYYNDKDYDKAISEGTALLNEDISEAYKAEVHKIIGESYFMKGDYTSAYPHLKDYLSVQQNPSENDLYEMGFVAAQLKNMMKRFPIITNY